MSALQQSRPAGLILCVGSRQAELEAHKAVLERSGFSVLAAHDAEEALQTFQKYPVDLVITEHMPGVAGARIAETLKRSRPEIPIVVLSGAPETAAGSQYGDVFLKKTVGAGRLLEAVKSVLSRPAPGPVSLEKPQADVRALSSLLSAVIEDSDNAIISQTLHGRIIAWNNAAERMYGYSRDEMIGKAFSVLVPHDRLGEFRSIMQRLKKGEKIERFETMSLARDDRLLNVSLTISPVRDRSGKVMGALTTARDVTQLKMAETSLRNSERLALTGRMAATIAHEISNPLEAIANALYLLEKSGSLDTVNLRLVLMAQAEMKSIMEITRNTLSMSREGTAQPIPVSVPELIENVLVLYGRKIQSLGIRVEKRFESKGIITGLPGELRQVFSNLVLNAADALALAGNRLLLHVYESADWRSPSRRGLRVSICDNATGIQPEYIPRIFEPFFSTKGEKGTGVGLWVTRGIVERHHGSIRVRSSTRPGRAFTCFSVFLPCQK